MQEEDISSLNIYQRLAKIRGIADVATKDKRGFNYTYADITNILAKVTTGMKKYNVSLIPRLNPETAKVEQNVVTNTKVDKKTSEVYNQVVTEMLVTLSMEFTWVNDDDPSDYIKVPWLVVGMQSDPSQAFGSGLTYCTRYFLTNYFQIAQPDTDVDAYRAKQREAEVSEDRMIAEEVIRKLDEAIKQYLAEHPDKQEDVKKFISNYVKNSNYRAIKDSKTAARLWKDFNDKYIKEDK